MVGRPDDLTGTAIVAFVTPKAGADVDGDELRRRRSATTCPEQIGAIAKPADIRFTDALPKTRSGKIMRRLLRDIASGKETIGDTTTLEDYSVLAQASASPTRAEPCGDTPERATGAAGRGAELPCFLRGNALFPMPCEALHRSPLAAGPMLWSWDGTAGIKMTRINLAAAVLSLGLPRQLLRHGGGNGLR